MRQITQWSPDTCSCVIQYEWDDEVPEDKREHKLYNILSSCKTHASDNPDTTYQSCLADNQKQNMVQIGLVDQAVSYISNIFS